MSNPLKDLLNLVKFDENSLQKGLDDLLYYEVVAGCANFVNGGVNRYPELLISPKNQRQYSSDGVGICINSGGTRAYSSMTGYMNALYDIDVGNGLNAFTGSQFITSASGGSWFTGTFFFASNQYSKEELLGKPIPLKEINNITLNTYNYDNEAFMGNRIYQSNAYLKFAEAALTSLPEKIWINAISKIFLDFYKIGDKGVTLSKIYADEIVAANPSVEFFKDLIYPPGEFPFWISVSSLIYTPTIDNGSTLVQMSPLYCGFPQILSYADKTIGGHLIESSVFGCIVPSDKDCEILNTYVPTPEQPFPAVTAKVPKISGFFKLKDIIGISSCAYAYATYQISMDPSSNIIEKQADRLNPKYAVWNSLNPGTTNVSQFGDGYISDGTGIVALLSRGVKKIISFTQGGSDYDSSTSPDILVKDFKINSTIAPLYGTCKDFNGRPVPNSTQVFKSSEYTDFLKQISDTLTKQSGAVYAKQKLQVLPNIPNGIEGDYELEILYIVLQPSDKFNSQLPNYITNQFSDPKSPLYNFPCYPEAEFQYDFVDYPKDKFNLLISYTYWTIMNTELKDIIKSFYE
jgi:hypothetical protein